MKVKRLLANLAQALGVMPQAYKFRMFVTIFYPQTLKNNFLYWIEGTNDGPPLPNFWARIQVAGTADVTAFLKLGRLGFESIRDTLERNGAALDDLKDVLDFGCGCGRVLRHWSEATARLHGTDLNEYLVDACRQAVPFATIGTNALQPGLPYANASFDLVYALSVFTHLDVEAQKAWRDEFLRILRPRGVLILSVHGDAYLSRLNARELAEYRAGRAVVRHGVYPGGNVCVAFHPASFVSETIAQGFEIVEAVPEGAKGNPVQDLYMLRKAA